MPTSGRSAAESVCEENGSNHIVGDAISEHVETTSKRPELKSAPSSLDPRKCWICLQNEHEDTPTTSEWRAPCACKLQAHEACLLDWIAEVERPKIGQLAKSKIKCPQCKTPIKVVRPNSLSLDAIRKIQILTGKLTIPLTAAALLGGVTYACYLHGLSTVYMLFGKEDAERMLGLDTASGSHSAFELFLPLVPAGLLAARSSKADHILPILPIVYFTLTEPRNYTPLWPPSPTITLICLPYVRAIYKAAWKYLFAQKEKAWMQELRPRSEDSDGMAEAVGGVNRALRPAEAGHFDALNFELGIEVQVVDDDLEVGHDRREEDEQDAAAQLHREMAQQLLMENRGTRLPDLAANPHQDPAEMLRDELRARQFGDHQQRTGQEPFHAEPHPPQNPDQPNRPHQAIPPPQLPEILANVNANRPAPPPPPQPVPNVANAIPIIINVFLERIIGALLFPSVAAGMGYALQFAMPKSWSTTGSRIEQHSPWFLQTRFGRSVVGGCLFVLLKDSLFLFQKYKAVQVHKHRKVVDYEHSMAKRKR